MKTNFFQTGKFLLTAVLLLSLSLSITNCSSDDGTDGVDGQTGATGPAGTANVIYSEWLKAPVAVVETIDGTTGMSTSINAPQLSADILAKGTILVYMSFGTGTYTLPYTSNAGGTTNTITAIANVNTIKFFRFTHSGSGTVNIPTTLNWRYILIPGGVAATTTRGVLPNYSKMSYEEVCAHFNIKP